MNHPQSKTEKHRHMLMQRAELRSRKGFITCRCGKQVKVTVSRVCFTCHEGFCEECLRQHERDERPAEMRAIILRSDDG